MQSHLANEGRGRKWLLFAARNLRQSVGSIVRTDAEAEWLATTAEDRADGRITTEQVNQLLAALPNRPTWTHYVLNLLTFQPPVVFASFSTRWAAETMKAIGRPDTVTRPHDLPLQAHLLRCVFGNPFHPIAFAPEWRTDTAVALAHQVYESRDFSALPILADALQDAGCNNHDILGHCRGAGAHVRGCWVVDLVLGKE
jgi:hypothetical protein